MRTRPMKKPVRPRWYAQYAADSASFSADVAISSRMEPASSVSRAALFLRIIDSSSGGAESANKGGANIHC